MPTAHEIISRLDLSPHPEGGWFKETWRAETKPDERAAGTAIYYLLEEGQRSHWHRVDATEIWHFYAGAALKLSIAKQRDAAEKVLTLGGDIAEGERPQAIVPAHYWQSAMSLGAWTLVGCTVSPGFQFEGFELAPANWKPAAR